MHVTSFLHNDSDETHNQILSLHDCVADNISYHDGILRFCFPDGFWITPHHRENHLGKTVRTDASAVDFSVADIDDILVRVFTRHIFRKTTVEIWEMKNIMNDVNNGKYIIEFICQYRSHFEQMWHCAIRSAKKPYYRECQIFIPDTAAVFRWNALRPGREW